MKTTRSFQPLWRKAPAPFLGIALGTVCPQLPEPLLEQTHGIEIPAHSELCIHTQEQVTGWMWNATLHFADSTWSGPEHTWQGEIGCVFQRDSKALVQSVNESIPRISSQLQTTLLWSLPLAILGVTSLWVGNVHHHNSHNLGELP